MTASGNLGAATTLANVHAALGAARTFGTY